MNKTNVQVELLLIWSGSNIVQIIQEILSRNEDITIRVQGNRLVIKDKDAGFYRCISIGDPVEIPKYEPGTNRAIQTTTQSESELRIRRIVPFQSKKPGHSLVL